MLGNLYTFPELLIWIPFISGIVTVFIKNANSVKWLALLSSLFTLSVSVTSLFYADVTQHPGYYAYNHVSYYWLPYIGSSFHVGLDELGALLTFLTSLVYFIIFLSQHKSKIANPSWFYSLMLLLQAGLMGVFVAYDALLFYFFWELTVIPFYFLISHGGGVRRISVTFKFFIYNFTGSLLMLAGILYVYSLTPQLSPDSLHSFSIAAFYKAQLSSVQQFSLFWLFFLAFAIRIPLFPFHTWHADTLEQSPFSVAMVLSVVMVAMGILSVIRWLIPVFPEAVELYGTLLISLSVAGVFLGSIIALFQDNLVRLVSWASFSQIGLIGAAVFSLNVPGVQGAVFEVFNHGVNILGLWIMVSIITNATGTVKISELKGRVQRSPVLLIFLIIILLANIGFPFTNSFVSKVMMLSGLFTFNKWLAVLACSGIVFSVVYFFNMLRKIFYAQHIEGAIAEIKLDALQTVALTMIVLLIIVTGIFPDFILRLTEPAITLILGRVGVN